jgi:hypothetical protein
MQLLHFSSLLFSKMEKMKQKSVIKTIKRTPYYRPNDEKPFSFFSKPPPLPPPVAS